LPNILGGLIVGYIFNFLFTFVLPTIGKMVGSEVLSTSILGSVNLAWIGIVICVSWQAIAFNTIIYISGLQTIPTDIYEASAMDGAGRWTTFWKITFPLIAPFFTINMVLCMRNFLMVFDQTMSLTQGGPAQSTTSISMLIYNNGLTGNQFGYQSANSVIYFIVIVAISVFQLNVLNKREVQL
jgi:raffinose/stachyose/melibiose transport system permease protein